MSLYCYFSKQEPSTLHVLTRPPSGSSLVQNNIEEASGAAEAVTKNKT